MTKAEFKTVRTRHKLTQKAMAEALGVTSNYISRLERASDVDTPVTQRIEKLVRLIFREKKERNT